MPKAGIVPDPGFTFYSYRVLAALWEDCQSVLGVPRRLESGLKAAAKLEQGELKVIRAPDSTS